MAKPEITIDTVDIVRRQAQIYGSNGGTKEDIAEVYELLRTGDVKPAYTVIDFDDIPQGLDDLEHTASRDASWRTSPIEASPVLRGRVLIARGV